MGPRAPTGLAVTTERAGTPGRPPEPARTPVWAAVADVALLALAALWCWVYLTGGTRIFVGPLRVSLRSHWRIAAAVLAVAAVRHVLAARPPFLAWLVRPLREWPPEPFRLPAAPASTKWWQGAWGALCVVTGVWAVMTWPQVTGMSTLVADPGDPYMKIWQLSWVAHQLLRDPLRLYDANIFHPEVRTLAFSDAMLGPSLVAAPLLWAGVSDVLVFNLLFAAGIILSGVGMFVLVRRLTADWRPAMVAALAYACLPYRFVHYSHLELQFTWGIPLALCLAHRVFDAGRLRDGLLLGLVVGLQAACSLYYTAYLGVFLAGVGVILWRGSAVRGRSASALAAGALVAGLCAVFVVMPYVTNRASVGERGIIDVEFYSATPANYLAPPEGNRLFGAALKRFGEHEKRLFPGFLLAALALVGAWPLRSVPRLAYAAGTLLAFDASLGSNGLVYPLLFHFVPGFKGFRVPARFGMFTATGLVVLAGYGAARLGLLARKFRGGGAVFALLAAALLIEYRSCPLALFEAPGSPPPVYAWLARQPSTVLAELPVDDAADFTYMYWSRLHWHPLLNGQSGFFPSWYQDFRKAAARFPEPDAVRFLRSRGVRRIVLHGNLISLSQRAAVERRVAESAVLVRSVAAFTGSGDRVFEIQ